MESNLKFNRYIHLDNACAVGYLSIDAHRMYHQDLSQLKYLTFIPKRKLEYNLNNDIEQFVKKTTDEEEEKLSILLKYLLDQKSQYEFLQNDDTTFITYRRVLIDIMISSFNQEPISIVASLLNNCFYLCSVESPQKVTDTFPNDQIAKFTAWRYKFEQYMLSDAPHLKPNVGRPMKENEEFFVCNTSQLGRHKLFFASQIDAMVATSTTEELEIPETSDFNTNLAFLRNNHFAELKITREIHSHRQEQNFKRYKMIRCWCQCYLAALKGLLVGYRDDDGIIRRVQWFDTDEIVRYCQNEWNPQTAIDFLDYFLSYVEKCFKSLKATPDDKFVLQEPLTLKFDMDSFQKITVSKDIYNDHEILPDWFVDHLKE